jgi:hypothetical protein
MSSILNLADIIADLGNIGINVLQLMVWGVRLVTCAYFGKEVSDYFMRDRALTFIRTLIIDEFGKKDGENPVMRWRLYRPPRPFSCAG